MNILEKTARGQLFNIREKYQGKKLDDETFRAMKDEVSLIYSKYEKTPVKAAVKWLCYAELEIFNAEAKDEKG